MNDVDPVIARFDWIDDESELAAFRAGTRGELAISIPELGFSETIAADDLNLAQPAFRDLGETGYAIRVRQIQDYVEVPETGDGVSFAIVDVRTPEGEFNRWVFDEPRLHRDQVVNEETGGLERVEFNDAIEMEYAPPVQRPLFHFLAGPGERDLRVIFNTTPGVDGQVFSLREAGPGRDHARPDPARAGLLAADAGRDEAGDRAARAARPQSRHALPHDPRGTARRR